MEKHPLDDLSAYADNELDVNERLLIETHLKSCKSCRVVLDDILDLQREISGFYRSVQAPDDFEIQVMQAIGRESAASSWIRAGVVVPLAGAVCLLIFGLLWGPILLKLMSMLFKFFLAIVILCSNLAASLPSTYGMIFIVALLIVIVSGLSLRRLLRTTTQ